ncbi:hypothetical protein L1285_20850 [Pseudoalteromonas sp. DL2-H2.2]|uniref:hypothetical protein n=1 Tax=Pseudoalteromonas sp. DL2-H2.2 TaxID=2908889 RepID=UPI001F38430F|nr:hypothetical protein [Pseudoalteromonas sp. DL2-H2.2]MCF2910760.1 hypothetical protein [Pseudoalteromonas sp. DL2-H2.2]
MSKQNFVGVMALVFSAGAISGVVAHSVITDNTPGQSRGNGPAAYPPIESWVPHGNGGPSLRPIPPKVEPLHKVVLDKLFSKEVTDCEK